MLSHEDEPSVCARLTYLLEVERTSTQLNALQSTKKISSNLNITFVRHPHTRLTIISKTNPQAFSSQNEINTKFSTSNTVVYTSSFRQDRVTKMNKNVKYGEGFRYK